MANGIERETFQGMDVDSKLMVLFDYAKESHRCSCEATEKIDALKDQFNKRKRFDTSVATLSGIVSGALTALGVKIGA